MSRERREYLDNVRRFSSLISSTPVDEQGSIAQELLEFLSRHDDLPANFLIQLFLTGKEKPK